MRTRVLQEFATPTPWLEYDPPSGVTEKTLLPTFPFTIGRNDSADLPIDSHQVSREHAVITKHGKKYKVRDLGSTNGTFVNGQRVEEATLNDGDLLAISDVELTFFCGASGAPRQTATQILSPSKPRASAPDAVAETILAVRRAQEAVTQRSLRTLFQPIVELSDESTLGYEAFFSHGAAHTPQARSEQWAATADCRAAARVRRLARRLAVEEAARLPRGARLFLAVSASEIALPALVQQLGQLRELVGANHELVVEVPDAAVRATAHFSDFLAELRNARIQVAYDDYASGRGQIAELKDIVPDFLKLAPALVRSMQRGEDRKRQVRSLIRTSHDLGCSVIATGIDSEVDLEVCRETGCTLAQGVQFGSPQSVSLLLRGAAFCAH